MTTIRIGELPAPLLPFFRQYLTNRGNQKTMNHGSRWLFPGTHAGYHITAQALMHQFRAAGIDIQAIRNAALHDLVKEIDAASLADLLGYTSQTINIHAARGGPNGHLPHHQTPGTPGPTAAPELKPRNHIDTAKETYPRDRTRRSRRRSQQRPRRAPTSPPHSHRTHPRIPPAHHPLTPNAVLTSVRDSLTDLKNTLAMAEDAFDVVQRYSSRLKPAPTPDSNPNHE